MKKAAIIVAEAIIISIIISLYYKNYRPAIDIYLGFIWAFTLTFIITTFAIKLLKGGEK